MSAARRIGLLGGMFDPIHCGHLDVASAAERILGLTELIVLPANLPPHRARPLASSYHRFAMTAMAIAGRPGWRALDLELSSPDMSYTASTLRRFHRAGFGATELFFIIGADAFLEIATWHDYPAVLDLAHFAVVSRPGASTDVVFARLPALQTRMIRPSVSSSAIAGASIFLINAKTADVSSTAIRSARLGRQPIAGLVPPAVQQHIEQHGLYEDSPQASSTSDLTLGSQASRLHGQD